MASLVVFSGCLFVSNLVHQYSPRKEVAMMDSKRGNLVAITEYEWWRQKGKRNVVLQDIASSI